MLTDFSGLVATGEDILNVRLHEKYLRKNFLSPDFHSLFCKTMTALSCTLKYCGIGAPNCVYTLAKNKYSVCFAHES